MIGSALAVDSNPVQLAFTARALTDLSYEVFTAATFEDANRHLLSAVSLAVLISDVRLGEYNGIHLALRARTRHPNIRVIITQDTFDPTLEFEAKRLDAVYCVKPLSAPGIAAAIEHLSQPQAAAVPAGVVESLAETGAVTALGRTRRWPRKQLGGALVASINDREAQLIDISYGGLCVEFPHPDIAVLPTAVDVVLPTFGRSLKVHPVWTRSSALPARLLCGSEVIENDPQTLEAWHHFVDACTA